MRVEMIEKTSGAHMIMDIRVNTHKYKHIFGKYFRTLSQNYLRKEWHFSTFGAMYLSRLKIKCKHHIRK